MSWIYLIIGIILGCVISWVSYSILRYKRYGIRLTGNSNLTEFQDNVSKLITEFNKISNTNINILEDKIRDLKEAIRLADESIVKINSYISDLKLVANRIKEDVGLSDQQEQVQPPPAKIDISLPAAVPTTSTAGNTTEDELVVQEEDKKRSKKKQKTTMKKVSSGGKKGKLLEKEEVKEDKGIKGIPILKSLPKSATMKEKEELIVELVSAGFSIDEISRAVKLSQTEVQLILGLKKRQS
jgi:hypothetical protein